MGEKIELRGLDVRREEGVKVLFKINLRSGGRSSFLLWRQKKPPHRGLL